MSTEMHREFPEIIETERLLLRSPRAGDGAELNAAIRESFEQLHAWMEWADHMPTVEESEENCRTAYEKFLARTDFPLQARLKSSGELVLRMGLHPLDWKVPSFEIGYWRRKGFDGQGYVTEAVRAVTRLAFETLGANRVQICCDSRNIRSRNVAERAGYRLEAELRNAEIALQGGLRNTLIFALIPADYAALCK